MDNNMDDEFCLKWNSHHSTFMNVLHSLLQKEVLVDVTLAAEGKFIEAHRLVLCTCSDYFQDALSTHVNKHAFIFLNNVAYEDLRALVDYMYKGEVNVSQDQLPRFLATAEALKIKDDDNNPPPAKAKGNSAVRKKHSHTVSSSSSTQASSTTKQSASPPHQLLSQSVELHEDDTQILSQNESSPRSLNEDLTTPDDNFIAVDAHDELDQTEDDVVGIGTLGRVWSLNENQMGAEWDQGTSLLGESSIDASGYSAHDSTNTMDLQQDIETVKPEEFTPGPSSAKRKHYTSPIRVIAPAIKGKQGAASSSEISYSAGKVSCPRCGRCYSQKGSLNRHLKYECSIVPKFPCPYCPLRFRRAYKLTEHHARFHAHEGPLPPFNNGNKSKT